MEVDTESEVNMTKKLAKISAGVATLVTGFYWGVLPALAIDLCPDKTKFGGADVPGCAAGFSLERTIGSVVGIMFFAAFIVALVFLVIGGVKWIMSGGDKEGTQKARETVTSALIGLAVVLGSYILINILLKLILGKTLNDIGIPQLTTQ